MTPPRGDATGATSGTWDDDTDLVNDPFGASMTTPSSSPFSRRVVLGAVAAGAVVPATACGSGSSEDSGADATRGANGEVRFPAGDVPVGGGRISATERVVVTQPAEGEF